MAIKKKAAILDELNEVEKNIEKASDAEKKHSEKVKNLSIKNDPSRNIYKNIKVSATVENQVLDIQRARRIKGEKGSSFDSIVYEAILEYLEKHFEEETGTEYQK